MPNLFEYFMSMLPVAALCTRHLKGTFHPQLFDRASLFDQFLFVAVAYMAIVFIGFLPLIFNSMLTWGYVQICFFRFILGTIFSCLYVDLVSPSRLKKIYEALEALAVLMSSLYLFMEFLIYTDKKIKVVICCDLLFFFIYRLLV